MPTFAFRGPNGRIVEIETPEGVTQEEASQFFNERILPTIPTGTPAVPDPAASMQAELAERTPFEKFMGGVGATTLESYLGAKQLFTDLSPEDQRTLEFLEGLRGGAATAGRVTGDVAMLAAPGAGGAKVATTAAGRVLPRALATRKATPGLSAALGAATGVGAFEGARTPGTAEERLSAARRGAVGTLAGQAAAGAVLKGLSGLGRLGRSPQGQRGLDEGIPYTPGQAAGDTPMGRVVEGVESAMTVLPVIGPKVQRMQRAGTAGKNLSLLRQTMDDIVVSAAGKKGFREAQDAFGTLYDDFWKAAIDSVTPQHLQKVAGEMNKIISTRAGKELSDEAAQRVTRYMASRLQPITRRPTAENLQRLNQNLRDYAQGARKRGDTAEAELVEEALAGLQGALGPNRGMELAAINRGYAKLQVLQDAARRKAAQSRGGIFSPDDLENAVARMGTPRTVTSGRALLSREAEDFRETVGNLTGGPSRLTSAARYGVVTPGIGGAAFVEPMVTGTTLAAGRALTSEPMRKVLTGQTGTLGQRLRNLSGIVGAATATE